MTIIWKSKKLIQKCIFTNDCYVWGSSEKLLLIIPFSLTLCMCVLGGNCVSMWGRCQLLWVEPTFRENSSATIDLHLCTAPKHFYSLCLLVFFIFVFSGTSLTLNGLYAQWVFGFDNPVRVVFSIWQLTGATRILSIWTNKWNQIS